MRNLLTSFKRKDLLIFGFILGIAAFLRFYRAPALFVFSGDEEHQMSLAMSLVKHFHIEWVGVSSADTGFYLGPFWIYFGALWLFLSKGDPGILAYVAPTIGVATTALLYVVARRMFSSKVAIISSLLYATLPLVVFYDKKFWNPHPSSITTLALLGVLFLTLKNKKLWIVVSGIYAFTFHVHLSLVPLGLVLVYFFLRDTAAHKVSIILPAIAIFLLGVSPLIAFDYFTHGQNIGALSRVSHQVENGSHTIEPLHHLVQLTSSVSRLFYLSPGTSNADEVLHDCSLAFTKGELHIPGVTTRASQPVWILGILALVIFALSAVKTAAWKSQVTSMILLFSLTFVACYIFLPNVPLEYYLLGFFPLLLIVLGLVFAGIQGHFGKVVVVTILGLSLFSGVRTVVATDDSYGLVHKKFLVNQLSQEIGTASFRLEASGLCHKYEGWRFLFTTYGVRPAQSFTDANFAWIYPDEIAKQSPELTVVIQEDRVPHNQLTNYLYTTTQGGFTGYVIKN